MVKVKFQFVIFGNVGRISSEEVVLQLVKSKCLPILLYCLEVCPLTKTDLKSLDFVINGFFMKLFRTSNIDTVKTCQLQFTFDLPSVIIEKRAKKFKDSLTKVKYTHTNHVWDLWGCWYSTVYTVIYLCDLDPYQLYTSLFCCVNMGTKAACRVTVWQRTFCV